MLFKFLFIKYLKLFIIEVLVADAKLNFDDNAEFRQKNLFDQRDFTQEDPRDVEAKKLDVN